MAKIVTLTITRNETKSSTTPPSTERSDGAVSIWNASVIIKNNTTATTRIMVSVKIFVFSILTGFSLS